MIIPKYWAEAKTKTKFEGRQYTIKRFGWSDQSLEAAQIHAEQRVTAVIEKIGEDVQTLFHAIYVDPHYDLMCRNQNCFRARISPKPWRIGVERLRQGVWPVKDERLAQRESWIRHYEQHARHYASCRFIKQFGSQTIHEKAKRVQSLHDEYCKSSTQLDIA